MEPRPLKLLVLWLVTDVLCNPKCTQVLAQDDDFEYFRCDACSATFFKVNKTLVERLSRRKGNLPSFEFLDVLENICDSMFTKDEFGVKQHEGKKYLFGPGITDHIPDQGFGQMGMGDYDKRLSAYCRMFIEEVGEDQLQQHFSSRKAINHTQFCLEECTSSASGSVAPSKRRVRSGQPPSPPLPAPPPPPPKKRKKSSSRRQRGGGQKKTPQAKQTSVVEGRPASEKEASSAASTQQVPLLTGSGIGSRGSALLESALLLLPGMSPHQLQWLGEAVLQELARRAVAVPSATTTEAGAGPEAGAAVPHKMEGLQEKAIQERVEL